MKSFHLTLLVALAAMVACNRTSDNTQSTSTTDSAVIETPQVKTTQDAPAQPTNSFASEFIPSGYALLDTCIGDLNHDQFADVILVLKKTGEDTMQDAKRPLLILLGQDENKFEKVDQNDNTVLHYHDGGVMGDPFMGITIKNGYFSVEHYGGSAWRWTRIITYKYSKEDQQFYLSRDGSESFHSAEPEKVESTIRTAKDFGKVKFSAFDITK